MIFEAVLLSLGIGILRKGKLGNFARLDVKWIYLFMFGALGQAIIFILADPSGEGVTGFLFDWFYVLHALTYILILLPLFINFRMKGFHFMAIGTIMNLTVILFNGGKMPVKVPEGISPVFDLGHTLWVGDTRLKILADFIYVGPPYPLPKVLSIGDLFIIVGVFWFIQWTMLHYKDAIA